MLSEVIIDYTNHRGERGVRTIKPIWIKFTTTEWHKEPQWVLSAWDLDKSVYREFAMKDIHSWTPKK